MIKGNFSQIRYSHIIVGFSVIQASLTFHGDRRTLFICQEFPITLMLTRFSAWRSACERQNGYIQGTPSRVQDPHPFVAVSDFKLTLVLEQDLDVFSEI